MNSKENVGNLDRIIRVYAAIFLMASFALGLIPGVTGIALFIAGIFLLITALIGVCPFYKLTGIHTTRRRSHAR
jgi:Protein of unknown function (DUF2892)